MPPRTPPGLSPHAGTRTNESGPDWSAIASAPDFRALLRAKRRFIIPASIFFICYYFALPLLVGYFPTVMEQRVIGALNLAYLFALSQFIMAWAVMWLYARQARRWDATERQIAAKWERT